MIQNEIEQAIMDQLRKVYDPEIRVNIVDLGLIYSLRYLPEGKAEIIMTLTAPNCPVSENIVNDVKKAALRVPQVKEADVQLVWDPPWNKNMMSEEAKLMLGYL